ncbi:MAG: sensor histidine kinase [Bacteroidota bacterium]
MIQIDSLFSLLANNRWWYLMGLVTLGGSLFAQSPRPDQQVEFDAALKLLTSFQNDSAYVRFTQLAEDLEQMGELDSPFGLQVQVRQAEALEKDHQDEAAIEKLLRVIDLSLDEEQWEVLANAKLSLARLTEKLDQVQSCYGYLQATRQLIMQHGLPKVYARYCNRRSSYHRLFADQDSALYFAKEALRSAPDFDLDDEESTAHLLIGLILDETDFEEAIYHFRAAGARWKEVGDISGYEAMLGNLSKLYWDNGDLKNALVYNDSAIQVGKEGMAIGNARQSMLYVTYQRRASILSELGRLDSALYYLAKGYQMEVKELSEANTAQIIEIEAKYKDEKKAQQIEEQQVRIEQERRNRWFFIGGIVLTLLAAGGLLYLYLRLREANQKTQKQAEVISEANQNLSVALKQQIMLQGEVHHRVKNNLQVLISLMELQREEIEDPQALASLEAMANRIHSIAAIHEILYQKEGEELVSLQEYTQNLCSHFGNLAMRKGAPEFQIDMGKLRVNLATLMPLGIILNELLTNSLKYGASLGQRLAIRIWISGHEKGYHLHYRDNGPGFPNGELEEREGGLGTYLLKSMTRQLRGTLATHNEEGAVFAIYFEEKNQR